MPAKTPVHFNIRSVSIPHHFPCICHFCKKSREREFQQMCLVILFEEVFVYYNQDWRTNLRAEMLFNLAVCYFLKRMQLAGRSCREAKNFVEDVVRSSNDEDELDER